MHFLKVYSTCIVSTCSFHMYASDMRHGFGTSVMADQTSDMGCKMGQCIQVSHSSLFMMSFITRQFELRLSWSGFAAALDPLVGVGGVLAQGN
jgi:hypothetical protein